MLVSLLLELCVRELPLFVVEVCASLGVDARVVVADHAGGVIIMLCSAFRSVDDAAEPCQSGERVASSVLGAKASLAHA